MRAASRRPRSTITRAIKQGRERERERDREREREKEKRKKKREFFRHPAHP